jgi:hypothetical protein
MNVSQTTILYFGLYPFFVTVITSRSSCQCSIHLYHSIFVAIEYIHDRTNVWSVLLWNAVYRQPYYINHYNLKNSSRERKRNYAHIWLCHVILKHVIILALCDFKGKICCCRWRWNVLRVLCRFCFIQTKNVPRQDQADDVRHLKNNKTNAVNFSLQNVLTENAR